MITSVYSAHLSAGPSNSIETCIEWCQLLWVYRSIKSLFDALNKTKLIIAHYLYSKRPGARFSKVQKLFGPISDATIPFISSQRRGFELSNFTILLAFLTLKACQKIKQADRSFTNGFSGPKRFRTFETCFSKVPTLFGRIFFYNIWKRPALKNKGVAVLRKAFRARRVFGTFEKQAPGARFSKVPKTFRARKAIRKTTTYLLCKAGLFIRCKGNKNKITAKFRASRRLRFEDTKRIMAPETRPKSFGTFEKQAPVKGWIAPSKSNWDIQWIVNYSMNGASIPLNNWGQLYCGWNDEIHDPI